MIFKKWFVTFIEEKGIDLEEGFVVTGPVFGENHMTYQNIYDLILQAPVDATKASSKKLINTLKTKEIEVNGRLGSDTVILKVFK